jgi:hypothetical protein
MRESINYMLIYHRILIGKPFEYSFAASIALFLKNITIKKSYLILAASTLAFLPLGTTALVVAIEAASTIGILVATTDVALDVTVLAVNDPEVMENNRERAEFVNTLAFFYGLARLTYGLRDIKGTVKDANNSLRAALKALLSSRRKVTLGTGRYFKFVKIISRNMIKQEEEMSCAAAVIRQYAKDFNIELTESELRSILKTSSQNGTDLEDIKFAMVYAFKG